MPITVQWLDDRKRILCETFEDPWTVTDYHQMIDEAAELLGSVSHTVHILYDARRTHIVPANILSGARYASKKRSPNEGLVVFVQANRFAQTIVTMAQKLFPNLNNLHFTETITDALEMLEAHIEAEKTKA